MPLITCSVATRDRPALVLRAVKCALAQTGVEVEVLVLDDGPVAPDMTDPCWTDERVRHMRVPSMSLAAKRNLAAQLAAGDYLTGFDDDDWSPPWRLSAQLEALHLTRGARMAVVGPRMVFHDLITDAVYVNCLAPSQWFDTGALLRSSDWQTVPADTWQHLIWLSHQLGGPEAVAVMPRLDLFVCGIDDWNRPRRNLSASRWKRWAVDPARLYDGTAPYELAPTRYGRRS
jgi:hypothetical protein